MDSSLSARIRNPPAAALGNLRVCLAGGEDSRSLS